MRKATDELPRHRVEHFQQIPNIGPAMERDFRLLGLQAPIELAGRDPWQLYCELARLKGHVQDPCVLDVMVASIEFMSGSPAKNWWAYTPQRKRIYGQRLEAFRAKAIE